MTDDVLTMPGLSDPLMGHRAEKRIPRPMIRPPYMDRLYVRVMNGDKTAEREYNHGRKWARRPYYWPRIKGNEE